MAGCGGRPTIEEVEDGGKPPSSPPTPIFFHRGHFRKLLLVGRDDWKQSLAPAITPMNGNGVGMSAFDCNQDGRIDLFVGRVPRESSLLFINRGNGFFAQGPVGPFNQVPSRSMDGHRGEETSLGSCAADYDNNGKIDLAVGMFRSSIRLYNGDGNCNFSDVTSASGMGDTRGITQSCLWGDFNADGCVDLFTIRQPLFGRIPSGEDVNLGVDQFYQNKCDGTFKNITGNYPREWLSGGGYAGALLYLSPNFYQGSRFFDLPGVFVAVDQGLFRGHPPSYLLRNDGPDEKGEPKFTKISERISPLDRRGYMGAAVADLSQDGIPEIIVSDTNDTHIFRQEEDENGGKFSDDKESLQIPLAQNREGRILRDYNGWGAIAHDFDNNSWSEVFVPIGPFTWPSSEIVGNLLFFNSRSTFVNRADAVGVALEGRYRSAVAFDVDGDGDLDLVVAAVEGSIDYLRNDLVIPGEAGAAWLGFNLRGGTCGGGLPPGRASNCDAIGATILINLHDGKILRRDIFDQGLGTSVRGPVHFGLGEISLDLISGVRILWPVLDGEGKRLEQSLELPASLNKVIAVEEPRWPDRTVSRR